MVSTGEVVQGEAGGEGVSETKCRKCGTVYILRPECDPTIFCDLCAQTILEKLIEMIPMPPEKPKWSDGAELAALIQKEIYTI
jgi:hypothetical protein